MNTDQQRMVNGDGVISVIEPVPVPPPDLSGLVTAEQLSTAVATLTGEIEAVQGDIPRMAYSFSQGTPATVWPVQHNLGRYPGGIVAQDSAGDVVECDITYVDLNNLQLIHSAPISGTAKIS
jgi:hypothetical protein